VFARLRGNKMEDESVKRVAALILVVVFMYFGFEHQSGWSFAGAFLSCFVALD